MAFCTFSLTIFFSFLFISFSSGFTVPSLASGLTSDNENSPVDYFMRHHNLSYQQQQHHHQQQQQHTPNSTQSSSSIKDELNDEKRGRSISPSISVDGSYACSQCSASFQSRDQLEKHEMGHSPNPPVVSSIHVSFILKIRNKKKKIIEKHNVAIYTFSLAGCTGTQHTFLALASHIDKRDLHLSAHRRGVCVCLETMKRFIKEKREKCLRDRDGWNAFFFLSSSIFKQFNYIHFNLFENKNRM